MTVHCPHCTARFVLPEQLLGPGGARVRCPRCGGQFEVARAIPAMTGPSPPAPERASAAPLRAIADPAASPVDDPEHATAPDPARREARAAVEELAALAPMIGESWGRGCLFAECGPALLAAFDAYRRRSGFEADPRVFHAALRERLGIDLTGEGAPTFAPEDLS